MIVRWIDKKSSVIEKAYTIVGKDLDSWVTYLEHSGWKKELEE